MSGHYTFWRQSVKANVLRTTRATASAFRTRSFRALFLPVAECQGKCPSGRHKPRHLPSGRVSGHYSFWTRSVKANVFRTTHATASAFWTTRAMAFAFWTRSVRAFFLPDAGRVLQTQIDKANVLRTACATASAFRTRSVRALTFWTQRVSSGRSAYLPDAECEGNFLLD